MKAEISSLSAVTDWMIVVIYCPRFLNHKGEMENDRQPSSLVQKPMDIFSIFLGLFIRFVSQEEASCCKGRELNEAGGERKDGRSGCGIADLKEFPAIWPLLSAFCQGLLARQVLP